MALVIDLTEAEFQRQVTEVAVREGWDWMHIGRIGKYTPNGAKGTLGTGWPDLVLVRGPRLIFAELKAQKAGITPQRQREVLSLLSQAAETHIWRPSDLPLILEVLQ